MYLNSTVKFKVEVLVHVFSVRTFLLTKVPSKMTYLIRISESIKLTES